MDMGYNKILRFSEVSAGENFLQTWFDTIMAALLWMRCHPNAERRRAFSGLFVV
jgi:hypothetical protein